MQKGIPFESKLFIGVILTAFIVFSSYIAINSFFLNSVIKGEIIRELESEVNKINSDLNYKNGKLDATIYLQDTDIPYDNTIYIITAQGVIIERNNPIHGLLDSADFEYTSIFTSPQTITTEGNYTWRVLSVPFKKNNKTQAYILTAYFNPTGNIDEIDEKLKSNISRILSYIKFQNNKIDVTNLDNKYLDYDVSYQVVDSFNNLIKEDGSPPTLIDRNLVFQEANNKKISEVYDKKMNERFIIYRMPLKDEMGNLQGILITGKTIEPILDILYRQSIFFIIIFLIFISIFLASWILLRRVINSYIKKQVDSLLQELRKPKYLTPNQIIFDEENNIVSINDNRVKVEYGSNQSRLCAVLFSKPNKRWTSDDIAEKLNLNYEDIKKRPIYFASKSINDKVKSIIGEDLIICEEKTYFLNKKFQGIYQVKK